jgi:hypothetical protein
VAPDTSAAVPAVVGREAEGRDDDGPESEVPTGTVPASVGDVAPGLTEPAGLVGSSSPERATSAEALTIDTAAAIAET